MGSELRFEQMMKSVDVYGRLAFGAQCVAAMAIVAGPCLLVTFSVLPFYVWDGDHGRAALAMLGGWALAVLVTLLGVALGVFAWRWSGDWITEWYGYAIGFAIAIIADGVLAFMLTSTPVPVYASFLSTAAAAFVVGALVANRLGGSRVLTEQFEQRAHARTLARRRP
jgi:hypothetical protein